VPRNDDERGWRKSTYTETGTCVEVLIGREDIYVRDSLDISGTSLRFRPAEWQAFVSAIKNGEFSS
jgi:hypothetical protein